MNDRKEYLDRLMDLHVSGKYSLRAIMMAKKVILYPSTFLRYADHDNELRTVLKAIDYPLGSSGS